MKRSALHFVARVAAVLILTDVSALAQPSPSKPAKVPSAQGKPVIPPGAPSRGAAVALLSDGIDYTRPTVAAKLARDGEGVVVGWDAIDNDARPFLRDGPATRLVEIAPTLIAPFRLDLASAASWASGLAQLARTPAHVAVVASPPSGLPANPPSGAWDSVFAQFPAILFIVPADARATVPAHAANVIVVAPLQADDKSGVDLLLGSAAATREAPRGSDLPTTALEAAILLPGVFACTDLRRATSPADVKAALIAKAAKGPPGSPPLLGLCR
jgi:hypothetical protein